MKHLVAHPEFRVGVAELAAAAPGIAAWGLMTGVAMVNSGLSLAAVLTMAIFVFAGSSQLAALPLFASGAPVWMILATSFCVNLRFVVFSAHLRPYVMHLPLWRRLLSGYLFADLSYVLFVKRFPQPGTTAEAVRARDAYWLGSGAAGCLTWAVSTLVGVALAAYVPVSWGLGFAGILALVGISFSLVSTRLKAFSAAVAGVVAIACYALPLKLNILVAIAAAVACGLLFQAASASRSAMRGHTGDDVR